MNKITYLDSAASGLVSEVAYAEGRKYDELLKTNASRHFFSFLENDFDSITDSVAKFIGVEKIRLSFAPNFSYAFSILLASIKPLKSRVLVLENDYPSLILPLELQKFNVTKLPSKNAFSWSVEEIESAILTNNIEILAISHAQYRTGFKADLQAIAEVCDKNDVLLIVDATQSLGAIPINFDELGIDVLIASNYKWMNAGFGSAVICFKSGFIEKYNPAIAGYGSLKPVNGQLKYQPSAASYFPGHMNPSALLMLGAAVKHKLEIGIENIYQHNIRLIQKLIEGLTGTEIKIIGPNSIKGRAPFLSIEATEDLHNHLTMHQIQTTYRNHSIRIGFHFTNTDEDVSTLLQTLSRYTV